VGAFRHRREKALIPGFLSHGVSASHLVIFRQDTPGNESGQGTNGGPKRGPDPTDNHGIAYRQSCPRRQSPRSSPTPGVMPRTRRRGAGGRFDQGGGRPDGRFSLHPENPMPESRMHPEVPVRFGRGRLDSLGNKGLAAYLMRWRTQLRSVVEQTDARNTLSLWPELFRLPVATLPAKGLQPAGRAPSAGTGPRTHTAPFPPPGEVPTTGCPTGKQEGWGSPTPDSSSRSPPAWHRARWRSRVPQALLASDTRLS